MLVDSGDDAALQRWRVSLGKSARLFVRARDAALAAAATLSSDFNNKCWNAPRATVKRRYVRVVINRLWAAFSSLQAVLPESCHRSVAQSNIHNATRTGRIVIFDDQSRSAEHISPSSSTAWASSI